MANILLSALGNPSGFRSQQAQDSIPGRGHEASNYLGGVATSTRSLIAMSRIEAGLIPALGPLSRAWQGVYRWTEGFTALERHGLSPVMSF